MKKAFTLVEILIVVAIIGLLAAIGIPSFLGSRDAAEQNMKDINISAVNAAKDQWAIMNNKGSGTTVNWTNIASFIGNGVTNQLGLKVGDDQIKLGNVGQSAYY